MLPVANKENQHKSNPDAPLDVLLAMAIQGDERAFRQIYDILSGKMYSLCIRYAGNTNDANDLFQEGIIKLYKSLSTYKGAGSFEGWARKIFVNVCLDSLKKKKRMLTAELTDHTEMPSGDLTGLDKVSNDGLMAIIQQLPDGYRIVVNLYLVEGYNHKEIADMLGISEGTSKSQLSRAKTLLQKNISAIAGGE
jgi:RNA polymerase sigma-70 factor (ECF subfamily)